MRGLLDSLWRLGLRLAYRGLLVWWIVRRPEKHGSHIAVWHGERVLVIQNSYRRLLSLPAGGRKRGETLLAAAVRELREEVGIRVEPHELSYHGEVVHRSRHAEDHAHVFELRCASAPEVSVDRREVISAEFLAPDDALSRGVIGVVRMYFEAASRAQRAQVSRSEPKASEDQQEAERRPVG